MSYVIIVCCDGNLVSRAFPYILNEASPKFKPGSEVYVGNCKDPKTNSGGEYIVQTCQDKVCDHKFIVSRSDKDYHERFYCACCATKAQNV